MSSVLRHVISLQASLPCAAAPSAVTGRDEGHPDIGGEGAAEARFSRSVTGASEFNDVWRSGGGGDI